MTMRDKIAEIVFGKLGAAFHGNTGNLLALELADAIIAALPELIPHYEAQQKRIKELESALRSILQIYLASTRDWDNTDGRYFDLQVGEIAEVTINEDNWIARSTKGLTQ